MISQRMARAVREHELQTRKRPREIWLSPRSYRQWRELVRSTACVPVKGYVGPDLFEGIPVRCTEKMPHWVSLRTL